MIRRHGMQFLPLLERSLQIDTVPTVAATSLGLCALAHALTGCDLIKVDGPQPADLHGPWDTKVHLGGSMGFPISTGR